MSSDTAQTVQPRGPAADPRYQHSQAPGNPYGFTAALLAASRLPPRVTERHVFFLGYEGDHPLLCLQQWFPAPFRASKRGNWRKGRGNDGVVGVDVGNGEAEGEGEVDDTEEETVDFPTSEHYMMYHKAVLMDDAATAAKILAPEHAHPFHAKRLGREVRGFDKERWTAHAQQIVEAGNYAKFGDERNRDLRAALLHGTGDRVIIAASPDDRVWGVGFDPHEAEAREAEWGDNGLGRALMRAGRG